MVDVSIQIVNYRTLSYLKSCLESLRTDLHGSPVTWQVKVLDNASGDDFTELSSLFPGQFHWYRADTNRGYGAGQNALRHHAPNHSRLILILNPDVLFVEPNTILRLVASLDASDSIMVGGRLVHTGPEGIEQQPWDHGELFGWQARLADLAGSAYFATRDTPARAAWVSGAALLIRTDWFDLMGGFDEGFFLYKEEEDLCRRLRKEGGVILYDPTIQIFHHGSVVAKRGDFHDASMRRYIMKHCRSRTAARLAGVVERKLIYGLGGRGFRRRRIPR